MADINNSDGLTEDGVNFSDEDNVKHHWIFSGLGVPIGTPGPVGSEYRRRNGQRWVKFGPGDDDWTLDVSCLPADLDMGEADTQRVLEARLSTNFSLNTTAQIIPWNAIDLGVSVLNQFTFPAAGRIQTEQADKYQLESTILVQNNDTVPRTYVSQIYLNGSGVAGAIQAQTITNGQFGLIHVSRQIQMAANDIVDVRANAFAVGVGQIVANVANISFRPLHWDSEQSATTWDMGESEGDDDVPCFKIDAGVAT